MKSKSLFQSENHKRTSLSCSSAVADLNQNETDFAATPDEAVNRPRFIYLSQGSPSGHDLQYWLEARAQLRAERYRILIHGFATRDQLTLESPGKLGVTRVRQNGGGKARPNYEQQLH
jgi:hypothetical protein